MANGEADPHSAPPVDAGAGTLSHASVLSLVLRRLRVPLLIVLVVFAISVAGFSAVPGVDADGRPTPPLSFFHAFYFVTYTATTIGFGELPVAFSDAQRMWASVVIYLTVIAWTWILFTLLATVQDGAFLRAISAIRFERRVRRISEPFLLVLGCGETGLRLIRTLDRLDMPFVVVERDATRLQALDLEDLRRDVVAIQDDAVRPPALERAGIRHRHCRAVLALTNDDAANVAVVITASLLNPRATLIARSHSAETSALMQASGKPLVVDPFVAFADQLMMALRAPGCYRLFGWLTALSGTPLAREVQPPEGMWIVCGYGRFGRAIVQRLRERGSRVRVIDRDAVDEKEDEIDLIVGDSTRRETLEHAGIASAGAIVVGTDSDLHNLVIARLAQSIRPGLFVVLRQSNGDNAVLFDHCGADLVMRPSEIVADECVAQLTSPLLLRFLRQVRQQTDGWADEVIHQLRNASGRHSPITWQVRIDPQTAPAICARNAGAPSPVPLGELLRDPAERSARTGAIALLALREGRETLLPQADWTLAEGDEILFAGGERARRMIAAALYESDAAARSAH